MKKTLIILSLILLINLPVRILAQGQGLQFMTGMRQEANPGYLMFLGDDRDQFATTVKGFGSGLMDLFNYRLSFDVIRLGGEKLYLTGGIGLAVNKYRFRDNLILEKQGGMVVAYADTVAAHDYVNTFFGYGKSKLVYGSVYFPLFINIQSENMLISAGGFYDIYLSGKHKRKFLDNGSKTIEKIPNSEFKDFNLNKGKLGLSFSITNLDVNYGISVSYMFTPFFIEGQGPALNELRIGIHNFTDLKALKDLF